MNTTKTRRLVESAILIAIASVLSIIAPFQLPFGGSVTLMSTLPIILIAYRYGVKWGIFSAFVFSIIQMLISFKTISAYFLPGEDRVVLWRALLIIVLDYFLAYTVIGLAGVFRNKFKRPATSLCVGAIFALSLRFLIHFTSGTILFGAWAEWFFSQDIFGSFGAGVLENLSGTALVLFYSLFYNGLYMVPEIIITAIGAVIIATIPSIAKKMD